MVGMMDRTQDRALAETRASVELHCGLAEVSRRLLTLAGEERTKGPWTPLRLAWASGVAHMLAAVSSGLVKRNVREGRSELLSELSNVADGASNPTPLLDVEWASALGCGGPNVFGTKGEALFSQSGNCTTDGRPFGVDTSRGSVWLPPNFPTGGLGLETSALETCASTQSEASRRPQSTARLEVVDRTKITCPGCGGGRGCSHCGYRGWVWHSLVDCPLCHSAVSVVDGEPELCDCQKYQQAREEDVR